ncbi:MAG TPA: hypothetical protein VLL75_16165 [Vicinamibacteria bacterium]|nr:hypothetical protein [Vicinamibacteria bacterium]
MTLEPTAGRVWKRLPPTDRLAAATHLLAEPAPEAVAGASAAIARARRMRPQAVRAMSPEAQARALGAILDPGESLAASLLVALHLGERRPLLRAFLDAMELPHEDGILKEEAEEGPPPAAGAIRTALPAMASFPKDQVSVYLNTLYLQDPGRWAALTEVDAP